MFEIVTAHNIGYAATASIGYPHDFMNKVAKAKQHNGTSYIHVRAPCPTGWSTPTDTTAQVARAAVDCGLWYLAEFEDGDYKVNKKPSDLDSVEKYLKSQGRFKHLTEDQIRFIEKERDALWNRIETRWQKVK
jgi:pyruvate ferredoxin oxidoreductase beta subunit